MHRRSRVAAFSLAGTAAVVALAGVTVGAQTPDGDGSTTTLVAPTTSMQVPSTISTLVPPVATNPFPGADLTFAAFLSSGQEVPPTVSTAVGEIRFALAGDGREITWQGHFAGLPEAAAGHLHWAPPGENGDIVVPLFEEVTAIGPFLEVEGTITDDDLTGPLEGLTLDALVAEIAAGDIYANVHTSDGVDDEPEPGDYPAGEIRGQVLVWTVDGPDTGGTTTTTGNTTTTTGDTTSTTGGTTSTTGGTTSTTGGTTSTTGYTTTTTGDTTSSTVGGTTSTTEDDTTATTADDDTSASPSS